MPTRVIEAARYYTFFTIDVADVLSFESMERKGEGELLLCQKVTDEKERQDILSYHREPVRIGARQYRLDGDIVGRCVGKYWRSLESVSALVRRISALREGSPFDLEFAFDEHPPEIPGPSCISEEAEVIFVARELTRRGLPVTHIAPNFGIEKGFDYRLADGLPGLQARMEHIHHIAEEMGYMLDIHSADDLSEDSRRVIRRATGGRLHYKISPMLHFIFAEVIRDYYPDIFLRWWNDAFDYARGRGGEGLTACRPCLSEYESLENPVPLAVARGVPPVLLRIPRKARCVRPIHEQGDVLHPGRRVLQRIPETGGISPVRTCRRPICMKGGSAMQLFLDSSDPREISKAKDWGVLDGVTTNPTLIARGGGRDIKDILRKVLDASPGPVLCQAIGWEDRDQSHRAGEMAPWFIREDHRQTPDEYCGHPGPAPAQEGSPRNQDSSDARLLDRPGVSCGKGGC